MALLSKLKSLLGIGGGTDDERRTETTVTVEHDPDEVVDDGVEASAAEPAATDSADTADSTAEPDPEPVDDAGADDAATEEPAAEQSDDAAAATTDEPTADTTTDDADPTVAVDDAEAESAVDEAEAADAEPEADTDAAAADYSDEPLDSIKGIGPAYSDRLHDAGITAIAELAEGDAEEIGDAISVSPKTVSSWIDRATEK